VSFPQLSTSSIFLAVVSLDTAVVGGAVYVFLRPKPLHVTAVGASVVIAASLYTLFKPAWQNVAFLGFAMILGVACIIVLGASIYTLQRLWKENKNNNERR
jgi:predicted membrane channel-forming protein YqfA (hemolysin III family)